MAIDILQKTHCEVYTFDCTGCLDPFKKPENDRLHFHHICPGASNNQIAPLPREALGGWMLIHAFTFLT